MAFKKKTEINWNRCIQTEKTIFVRQIYTNTHSSAKYIFLTLTAFCCLGELIGIEYVPNMPKQWCHGGLKVGPYNTRDRDITVAHGESRLDLFDIENPTVPTLDTIWPPQQCTPSAAAATARNSTTSSAPTALPATVSPITPPTKPWDCDTTRHSVLRDAVLFVVLFATWTQDSHTCTCINVNVSCVELLWSMEKRKMLHPDNYVQMIFYSIHLHTIYKHNTWAWCKLFYFCSIALYSFWFVANVYIFIWLQWRLRRSGFITALFYLFLIHF